MEELVSVIVPVYNVQNYLADCVNSILRQTYKYFEVILINDGSTDDSGNICDKLAKTDNRISVIHQRNTGLAGVRNVGLENAKGTYIQWVDSDDYIDESLLESAMTQILKNNCCICFFNFGLVDENGKAINKMGIRNSLVQYSHMVLNGNNIVAAVFSCHIGNYICGFLARRDLYNGIVFPTGRCYEDIAVAYKIFLKVDRGCCVNSNLYYYRQNKKSITQAMSVEKLDDYLAAIHGMELEIKKVGGKVAGQFLKYKVNTLTIAYFQGCKLKSPKCDGIRIEVLRTMKQISIKEWIKLPGAYKIVLLKMGIAKPLISFKEKLKNAKLFIQNKCGSSSL